MSNQELYDKLMYMPIPLYDSPEFSLDEWSNHISNLYAVIHGLIIGVTAEEAVNEASDFANRLGL